MELDYQAIIINEDSEGLPKGQGNGFLLDRGKGIISAVAHGVRSGDNCRVFIGKRHYRACFHQDLLDWRNDLALLALDNFREEDLPDTLTKIEEPKEGDEIIIAGYTVMEGTEEKGILRSYYNLNIDKEICLAHVRGNIIAVHDSLARMGIDPFLEEIAQLPRVGNTFIAPLEKKRLFYDKYIIMKVENLDIDLAKGLSGSPVVDAKGCVIGTFAIVLKNESLDMAAAVPISEAVRLLERIDR
ncbi:MAG: hypothetical protein LRZ87_00365 [Methanocellales archaeon]|nr:hypothetical protein [Methanocellales archaeon]